MWRSDQRLRRGVAALALVGLAFPTACGAPGRTLSGWTDPCDGSSGGPEPDHALFTEVLKKYVQEGELAGIRTTLVDYAALRQDVGPLRKYLAQLCAVDIEALSTAQKLATLINAYNAWMLAMVVHFKPEKSVLEISDMVPEKVWKHKFGTVAGVKVSLDDIEHGMIRGGLSKEFQAQGRIHAGVNCASLSCPDLLTEAFQAPLLSDQLTNATRRWLENPTKNPGKQGGGLKLSKIFDWYGKDFVEDSGSVQAYVKKYNPSWGDVPDSAPLSFETYSWSLNEVNGSGQVTSSAVGRGAGSFVLALLAALSPLSRFFAQT